MLNRIIRWTDDGWEIQPDQRHADIIVHELGLLDSKPVSTPGEMECRHEDEDNSQPLEEKQATKYRALAARANYLAGGRTDIMYAVKELARRLQRLDSVILQTSRNMFDICSLAKLFVFL